MYSLTEEQQLLKFINSIKLSKDAKILDVGCGYGRISKLLRNNNYNVTGVDINPNIVEANKK
jgi:2-polyprenyl-3-methyl-5-hydroxy-6-metoxy-1,4-benzoquinol methylase